MTGETGTPDDMLAGAYAHAQALVRASDRERFLAALFAPADLRRHLFALYAYDHEIARVRAVARQPIAGEIRLQWWRDALDGTARGEVSANPVAAALLATLGGCSLPAAPLVAMSEARIFDLYDDPMPSLLDLEGYAGETRSALIQLAALVLSRGRDPGAANAAGHAGVAETLVRVLAAFPHHAREGRLYVPLDVLERHGATADDVRGVAAPEAVGSALVEIAGHARHHFARAEAALQGAEGSADAAFLAPLTLADRLEPLITRLSRDPYTPAPEPAGWRTQIELWRVSRRLRRLRRSSLKSQ